MRRLKALDVDASGQMLAKASSCVGGGEYGAFNFSGCRESLRELVGLAVGIQRWTRQSLVAGDCDGAATDRDGHTEARKQTGTTAFSLAPGLRPVQVQAALWIWLRDGGSSRCGHLLGPGPAYL